MVALIDVHCRSSIKGLSGGESLVYIQQGWPLISNAHRCLTNPRVHQVCAGSQNLTQKQAKTELSHQKCPARKVANALATWDGQEIEQADFWECGR